MAATMMLVFGGLVFLHHTFAMRTLRWLYGSLQTHNRLPQLTSRDVFVHVGSGDGYTVFDRCLRTSAAKCVGITDSTVEYNVAQNTLHRLIATYPEYRNRVSFQLVYSLNGDVVPRDATVVYYKSNKMRVAETLELPPNVILVDGK